MSGYMKHRKALQLFGFKAVGIASQTKQQRKDVYMLAVEAGFYWDVGLKRWIPYQHLAQKIKDEFGPHAEREYLLILQDAGILDRQGMRTNKINLSGLYTQKLDMFIMKRVLDFELVESKS